jgi:hypothetical protein
MAGPWFSASRRAGQLAFVPAAWMQKWLIQFGGGREDDVKVGTGSARRIRADSQRDGVPKMPLLRLGRRGKVGT